MLLLLLVIAGVFAVTAAGLVTGRKAWTKAAAWLPLLAGLLLATGLLIEAPRATEGPFGKVRVTLESMAIRLAPGQASTLGGDPVGDDVVLSPGFGAAALRIGRGVLPPSFLRLERKGEALVLSMSAQPASGSQAVIRIDDGSGGRFLGAEPVAAVRACLARCGARDRTLKKLDDASVYTGGVIPVVDRGGSTIQPGPGGFVFTDRDGETHMVDRRRTFTARHTLAKGAEGVTLMVYEAEPSSPAFSNGEARPGRLVLRRTFFLNWDGETLIVRPETPQVSLLDLDDAAEGRPVVRFAAGSAADAPFGDDQIVVAFSLLGASFDGDLAARTIDIARRSGERSTLHQADGSQVLFAKRVALGEGHQIRVRIEPLDFDTGLNRTVLPFAALVLLISFLSTRDLRRNDPLAALAFGLVEFLLVMRLLVAMEGAFVDVAAKAQAALPAAVIALPLGCFVALAVHPQAPSRLSALVGLGSATLAAMALTFGAGHPVKDLTVLGILLLAGLGGLVWLRGRPGRLDRVDGWVKTWGRWLLLALLGGTALAAMALAFGAGEPVKNLTVLGIVMLAGLGGLVWLRGRPGRLDRCLKIWSQRPLLILLGGAALICSMRLVLVGFGLKEGLPLPGGSRLALSLIFVPLGLLVFAPLAAQAQAGWTDDWWGRRPWPAWIQRTADRARAILENFYAWVGGFGIQCDQAARWAVVGVAFGLALGVGVGAASMAARDHGFAIFALPLIIGAVAAAAGQPRSRRAWAADILGAVVGAAPILAVLATMMGQDGWKTAVATTLVLVSLGLLALRPSALWQLPVTIAVGLLLLVNVMAATGGWSQGDLSITQAIAREDNDLRLFAALDPARLALVGTRGSEGLQDAIAHMRAYGDTLLGRGYFTLPTPTVLRAYHLTDNAAAVHLVSPFGRLGAAALMIGPAALAFVACWAAGRRSSAPAWLGALAALTLATVSFYMILANLLAAPFTGRNVYLLAPWSTADLLEGLALIALVVLTLGQGRDPQEQA